MDHEKSPLQRAIDIVGSQTRLADLIGGKVKTGHIYYWLQSGVVPAEHCPAIEKATLGGVRCEELRPDVAWDVLRTQVASTSSAEAQVEAGQGA